MNLEIPVQIIDCWNAYKWKYNHFEDKYTRPNGLFKLWWDVPKDVLWLYATSNEENYEGSQTQIGIQKNGTRVWGFFSHCSCNSYEEYDGKFEEFIDTQKNYELEKIDIDILNILKDRIQKITRLGLEDEE